MGLTRGSHTSDSMTVAPWFPCSPGLESLETKSQAKGMDQEGRRQPGASGRKSVG